MQGSIPYWGANGILDYVNSNIFDEPLALLGEDGAPFFDKLKPVAFFTEGPTWPNNHIHVLRPRAPEDGRFIVYALNMTDYADFIDGSTRDKLTQARMKAIPLAWPPSADRLRVIDFLDAETARLDALTREAEAAIALLQERRAALISAAVTGKIDIRDATQAA